MNVGIFTDTYYPQINGVVSSVRTLERELNKLGHKVFIFTTTDPNANQSLPRVYRIPSMPFVFLPTHRMALVYPPKLLLRVRRLKLDIIHTQTEFPLGVLGKLVAELYDLPNVHTYHTMYEDYTHYVANGHLITRGMAKRYSRIFCNRARAVIAPVEKARTSLLEYGVKRPIHVIPTGIDLSKFKTPSDDTDLKALKSELNLKADAPVVLFLGRIAKEKSIDIIIKAMPELISNLPDARLLIVGGGPIIDDLIQLTEALGIRESVIFTGPKPWDIISVYYRLGDIFVTASTSETQGLTYIEAIAAQCPVIAKKDPSIEGLIVHGETGYLFEHDSELAGLMYQALSDKGGTVAVAENAYRRILELSSEKFASNVAHLYEQVVRDYTPRRLPKLAVWRKLKKGVTFFAQLKRNKSE